MDWTDIEGMLDDRPGDGVFRVHADAFRRQDVFELEMKHIFEGGWIFLGLDCQIPNPHDFFTTTIGRQPVIVSRDGKGEIHGLINSCRHRSALVCQHMSGNAKVHICPYHAWSYDSAGRNVAVTAEAQGAYSKAFAEEDRNLRRIARFGNYRGFLFGSLNPDVPPLEEHLGDARTFIDLVVDQGAEGLEIIPGAVTYTYNGNWKMQIENSADVYHFVPTHQSYVQVLNSRKSAGDADSVYRNRRDSDVQRGSFCFANGHNVMFGSEANIQARPLYLDKDAVERRVGETRLKWMFYTRNLLVFPNMQLLENASLQIRVNRPLSADKTEIVTYCVAPKGEPRAARIRRIRQYEEFYNPSGLATPDDTTLFEDCQTGQSSDAVDWHLGYMRGIAAVQTEPVAEARELGLTPETSLVGPGTLADETVFHGPLREWRRILANALKRNDMRPRLAREIAG